MRIGPFGNRQRWIGFEPIPPDLAEMLRALEVGLFVQWGSSKVGLHVGKLAELGPDMGLKQLLHRVRLDAELGSH